MRNQATESIGQRSLRRILFAVGFLGLFLSRSTLLAGDFETANQLYDQGKFTEAKEHYEAMVDRGEWSANLFYNLGNTDYRIGSSGRAMLNYERALALDHSHEEARANLKWLREQSGARVPMQNWVDYLFPTFSPTVLTWVAVICVWIVLFSAVSALVIRRVPGFAFVLFFVLPAGAYSAAALWHTEQGGRLAIVTAKEAQARLAPADRAELAEALPAGSRVRVLTERGDWIYCALPNTGRGWLPATMLESIRIRPAGKS